MLAAGLVPCISFLVNAESVEGLSEAVLRAEHRHVSPARWRIALAAASVIQAQLVTKYIESALSVRARTRANVVCELFAIYIVCRVTNSFSTLETPSDLDMLRGMRESAQRQCADDWARSVLAEAMLLEADPKDFLHACARGASNCLVYCLRNGQTDPFWAHCRLRPPI